MLQQAVFYLDDKIALHVWLLDTRQSRDAGSLCLISTYRTTVCDVTALWEGLVSLGGLGCASFLLLLNDLRRKNSFVVNLLDYSFHRLKSGVLALLFSLDETNASNRMKTHVEFYFSLEFYEHAQPRFSEIEIKYDGYLIIHH